MARAFIASVPLAIVLVAALVVPLTVIPGTFSFQSWPTSLGGQVTEQQVEVAPVPRTVVARTPRPGAMAKVRRGSGLLAAVRKPPTPPAQTPSAGSTPTHSQTLHGHRSTSVVQAPSGSGPGRQHEDPSSAPSPAPETPAGPAEPTPAPVPTPDAVASDEPPIARDDPADDPVPPPPAPVEEVAPQEPQRPAAPVPSEPPCDSAPGNGHGHGHGHGHGLGLALGHGRGHGADHH
jgi:hypothetical protein